MENIKIMSNESNQILNDLCQLMKTLPQNPVTKLNEIYTILLIFAIKTTDEKLKKDCQSLLSDLNIHYQKLSRKI